MKVDEDKYKIISCNLYDTLEYLAIKKQKCKISYISENKEKTIEDIITDIISSNKKEYAILKSNKKIRLDKIISINDERKNY